MKKLELRGEDIYEVDEKKMDGFDADTEIAILQAVIDEAKDKMKVFKDLKVAKEDKKPKE